jgi:hypothetical protein
MQEEHRAKVYTELLWTRGPSFHTEVWVVCPIPERKSGWLWASSSARNHIFTLEKARGGRFAADIRSQPLAR